MFYRAIFRRRAPITTSWTHHGISPQMSTSVTENDPVLVDEIADKVIITYNRPKTLNAMDRNMAAISLKLLRQFENIKSLVILKGAGNQSFSAGGDIRSIANSEISLAKDMFRIVYTMSYYVRNYKIPVVSLADGVMIGGVASLAIHGKYSVVTERTIFSLPEVGIGLFPDVGSSYYLPRLNGQLGIFLGMTAQRLRGEDVVKAGLATHYCESNKIKDIEAALLESKNSTDVANILDSFATKTSNEFSLNPYMEKINKYFAQNTVEEIVQSLERDRSKWAQSALADLRRMSPLSLKITLKELKGAANLSLAEALRTEFRIVSRCMEKSDYHEGVRALIIEKDKKPKWNPPTLQEVTDERVAEFFAKLPEEEELKL